MPTRSYLWGMGIGGTLTLAAFLLVLFYFDPTITGTVGVALFFISLLSTLVLWLTLILYLVRHRINPETPDLFTVCLRHASLITFIIGALLTIQLFNAIHWWNAFLVVLAAVVVEVYARIKVE